MRLTCALILSAAALLLAACGGSSTPASQTGSATHPGTQATAPTTTSSRPATTTSSTTSTAAPAPSPSNPGATSPICRAADFSGSFLGGQAASGHGLLGFQLSNTSHHSCIALGYPGVQFLSRAGQALPTIPTHTDVDFFGALTDHPLLVTPGMNISFRLVVSHGAASTVFCTTAYGLQVIPPNDTSGLRISIPNGAYECQTLTVSPMERGRGAYP